MKNILKHATFAAVMTLALSLALLTLSHVMPVWLATVLVIGWTWRDALLSLAVHLKQLVPGNKVPDHQHATSVTVTAEEWDAFIERGKQAAISRGETLNAGAWDTLKADNLTEV